MRAAGITNSIAATLILAIALLPQPALAGIRGSCAKAVGTFLTKNALDNNGREGTSRSLLVLTNGGHVLRFDSDETGAAMDSRPFGDSAGTWRCDRVSRDGTVHLTAAMLDFTFPDAQGDQGQIARIDVSGTYTPKTGLIELSGMLGFMPLDANGQAAGALGHSTGRTKIHLTGQRIELPKANGATDKRAKGKR